MKDRQAADLAFLRHACYDIRSVIASYPIELGQTDFSGFDRDELISLLNSALLLLRLAEFHISGVQPSNYD